MDRSTGSLDSRLLPPRSDAGADTDRARPGPPLPARAQQEPQLRRRTRRQGRLRPQLRRRHRPGAARPAARDPAAARTDECRLRLRLPLVDPAPPRRRPVFRHDGARLLPVPRHAQLRPVRRRRGSEEPAHRPAGRTAAAPLRRRRAPRGRRQLLRGHDRLPAAAVRPRPRRPLSACRASSIWCA